VEVQCDLCEQVDTINDHSLLAKRLIYRKVQSYLCATCYERIKTNTLKRHKTGKFHLFRANWEDQHEKNKKAEKKNRIR